MNELYTYELNGITWATTTRSSMVHATFDTVTTLKEYEASRDFDVFTVYDINWTNDILANKVVEFVGNSMLWERLYSDLIIVSDFDSNVICRQIEKNACFRENFILANYSSCEVEGNLLHIYSTNGNGFTVGHNKERLGDIVS